MSASPVSIVTGANTGIGRVTAETLAARGHHVVLAGRSEERTRPVVERIRAAGGQAEFHPLDLADLDQVADSARALAGRDVRLLVNNAGLAGHRGETKQGFELAFGVNHLGTFLFTHHLLPALKRVQHARVVTVASGSHFQAKRGIDWDAIHKPTANVTGLPEYEISKLGNVHFASELARREPSLVSVSLNPGRVASDIWRGIPWPVRGLMKLFMLSEEQGAETSLYCATHESVAAHSGEYFERCKPKLPSPLARDAALARETWERSEALLERWLA